ncbi:N-acetyl-alpha-D-glucosaminyl L-malate synthase BshA [Amphibacillus sediminis]|uniref:N-acetyl-alpha-D-glucosaminyl L-malate synthase BshA n=1 Tax=Amphibacillus sediminis TaxID=360185 RepID=UPI0008371275|nr:N-acetyl-alpha-D-glucosaminyl L-malate synthase BshA [Amphibacillus sediminis]
MTTKLKIGVTCYPSVGGSGIVATELGKQLASRGHDIHFITSDMPFRLEMISPHIYYHQVEMNHYPVFQYPPYDLALANKMAEVIDQEQLDVLHVHYAMPHAICAILAKQMANKDVKIVTTLHGTDITILGIERSLKKMIKYGIEQSDVVTAVSNSLAQDTYDHLSVNKPIEVIYNFIDHSRYYPSDKRDLKDAYQIKRDEKVIIHISNFRKVKRIDDVIHTFAEIIKHIPAKLLLVGDGPEYTAISELVEQLQIQNQVLFLGKQQNIPALLSIADLKLLMSEKESFGLVLIEAMACGVPCIGTKIGGIPEVIKHGENGYLVPLGDIKGASTHAVELLTDRKSWHAFSKQALKDVQSIFHANTIVSEYEALYYRLLKDELNETRC